MGARGGVRAAERAAWAPAVIAAAAAACTQRGAPPDSSSCPLWWPQQQRARQVTARRHRVVCCFGRARGVLLAAERPQPSHLELWVNVAAIVEANEHGLLKIIHPFAAAADESTPPLRPSVAPPRRQQQLLRVCCCCCCCGCDVVWAGSPPTARRCYCMRPGVPLRAPTAAAAAAGLRAVSLLFCCTCACGTDLVNFRR